MGIKKISDTEWELIHGCGGTNDYEEIEFVPEGIEIAGGVITWEEVDRARDILCKYKANSFESKGEVTMRSMLKKLFSTQETSPITEEPFLSKDNSSPKQRAWDWMLPPKVIIIDKSPEWVFTAPPALDWDIFTALKIKDLLLALASVMSEKSFFEVQEYIQEVLQIQEPKEKGVAMYSVYKCLKDNDILIQHCLKRGWELVLPNNKTMPIPSTTSEVNLIK